MVLPSVTLPRRPRPVAFVVSLVLAGLLLASIALSLRHGPIEDDLATRATDGVRRTGAAHARVTVEGRDAVVHGAFASAAAAEAARRSAAVAGTTSARLGTDVVIATKPARPVVVAVDGSGLTVTATVPDSESRLELLGAAAATGSGSLTGHVSVDPEVAPPAALALGKLVDALSGGAGTRSVTVAGSSVVVRGTVPDPAARAGVGARVLAAVRTSVPGATVDNELLVGGAADGRGTAASGTEAPPPGQAAERVLQAAVDGRTMTFPTNSAALSAADRGVLDAVAAALRPGTLTVLVTGHTDGTGPLVLNQALSLDRARAAVAYLVDRGVPAGRLRATGFGPDDPVAGNDTPWGRAANRRVEIILLDGP
jgi:outer membrane protein OmpA-like peptidoglycan-associated protein